MAVSCLLLGLFSPNSGIMTLFINSCQSHNLDSYLVLFGLKSGNVLATFHIRGYVGLNTKQNLLPAFEFLESAKRVPQYFSLYFPFVVSLNIVSASFAWPSTDHGFRCKARFKTLVFCRGATASGISRINERS